LAAEATTSGTRNAAYTYDPFGALRSGSVPANATSERWTGRWDKKYDSSSSLIEMGKRPYSADLGRFLAVDPIEGGSLNLYEYASQDPVNKVDLQGCSSSWRPPGWGFWEDLPGWGFWCKVSCKTLLGAACLLFIVSTPPPYGEMLAALCEVLVQRHCGKVCKGEESIGEARAAIQAEINRALKGKRKPGRGGGGGDRGGGF
jgi:RHS repeat-associated protein